MSIFSLPWLAGTRFAVSGEMVFPPSPESPGGVNPGEHYRSAHAENEVVNIIGGPGLGF